MLRIRLLAAAAVLALWACDTPGRALGPEDPWLVSAPTFVSASTVVGQATGGGSFNIGAPGADIAFKVNALLRSGGDAHGSVNYYTDLTEFGLAIIDMRFDVTCLAVDVAQGRAWIGGVVTANNSTNPTFVTDPVRQVGRDVWFRVQDNGSGATAELDRSTQLGFEGGGGIITSEEYCETRPWPAAPAHQVTRGNITVH